LYPGRIEFRVVIGEGYFCRGIRRFTDAYQNLHVR